MLLSVVNEKLSRLQFCALLVLRTLRTDSTLKDFVSSLARLPLAYQPGEVFEYGLSIDVLGRLIEVASRQPLDQFLGNRLFKPLGMVDTAFWVPPEKFARLVDPPTDAPIHPVRDVTKPTTLFSGGGGLVSTAVDYLRFCQMLLNGGELDGVRILTPGNRQPDDHEFAVARHPHCPSVRIAKPSPQVEPPCGPT